MFDQLQSLGSSLAETTLRQSAKLEGIGLHSGETVTMTILPAAAGAGISFQRLDLLTCDTAEAQAESLAQLTVPATPSAVRSTQLGTTISNEFGISVATVEHLMAAFAGMGIDNAIVQLDGPEIPIMDGSAEPFIAALEKAGQRVLRAPRKAIRVTEEILLEDGDRWIRVLPLATGRAPACDVDVLVDYADPIIGKQRAAFSVLPTVFRNEVAAARTFCYLKDVEAMQSKGLALGGSYDNAIVVADGEVVNEEGLRFDSEFAYHKALDLVGDLYLLGRPIIGQIMAYKPGHDLNTRFAQLIEATPGKWSLDEIDVAEFATMHAMA